MNEAEYLPGNIALTENGRPCLKESGDGCLDFFFQAVPGITKDEFGKRFAGAWRENPLIALRLVFQLGNCRRGDGGKLDRVNFLRGLMEVWKVDPETLLLNVREIAAQGCYKTLLDLLQEVLWGSFEANLAAAESHKSHRKQIRQKHAKGTRRKEKEARQAALKFAFANAEKKRLNELYIPVANSLLGTQLRNSSKRNAEGKELWRGRNRGEWVSNEVKDRFYKFIREREQSLQTSAKEKRLARKDAVAARVARMTENEKRLYTAVAAIFAEDLAKERQQQIAVAAGTQMSVSGLAAKWAPSPDGMHDRNTLVVDAIIALLDEQVLTTKGSTPRIKYQQMCAEIRGAAKIPESFIGRGEWDLVDYQRMPSVCRKVYGERLFKKHDEERYVSFLGDAVKAVQAGEKPKVHSGALLPHTVTSSAKADSVETDLQWHGLVTRLIQARSSEEDEELVVPVCDVSGSMTGEPMEVAIALSLLLAESAPRDSPLFGKMFTFHEQPELLTVPDIPHHAAGEVPEGGLAKQVKWVRRKGPRTLLGKWFRWGH